MFKASFNSYQVLFALENYSIVILHAKPGSDIALQTTELLLRLGLTHGSQSGVGTRILYSKLKQKHAISECLRLKQKVLSATNLSQAQSSIVTLNSLDGVSSLTDLVSNGAGETYCCLLTENALLREMLRDPLLKSATHIILDHCDEPSMNMDLIIALCKKIVEKRQASEFGPLKIIFPAHTANAVKKLKAYFTPTQAEIGIASDSKAQLTKKAEDVGILDLSAYSSSHLESHIVYLKKPVQRYLLTVVDTVLRICAGEIAEPTKRQTQLQAAYRHHSTDTHVEHQKGDVLVLLPGRDEIIILTELIADSLHASKLSLSGVMPEVIALPSLPRFQGVSNQRKVFLSTFETAQSFELALSRVTIVVDTGLTKQLEFVFTPCGNDLKRTASPPFTTLIQASASRYQLELRAAICLNQNSSEALHNRLVIRLFPEETLKELLPVCVPECQRQDLSQAVLLLKSFGISDIVHFDWYNSPHPELLTNALNRLVHINAIAQSQQETKSMKGIGFSLKAGETVPGYGDVIAELPVDPRLGAMLLKALDSDIESSNSSSNNNSVLADMSVFEATLSLVTLLVVGDSSTRGLAGFIRNTRFTPNESQLRSYLDQSGAVKDSIDDLDDLLPHLSLVVFEGDHFSCLSALTTFEILSRKLSEPLDSHSLKKVREDGRSHTYDAGDKYFESFQEFLASNGLDEGKGDISRPSNARKLCSRKFLQWCGKMRIDVEIMIKTLKQRKYLREALIRVLKSIGSETRAKYVGLSAFGQNREKLLSSWRLPTQSKKVHAKLCALLVSCFAENVMQRVDDAPAETAIAKLAGVANKSENLITENYSVEEEFEGDYGYERSRKNIGRERNTSRLKHNTPPSEVRSRPAARYIPFGGFHKNFSSSSYQGDVSFKIHPSSILHDFSPQFIIFTGNVISSTDLFMTQVSSIPSAEFLAEASPIYFEKVTEAELIERSSREHNINLDNSASREEENRNADAMSNHAQSLDWAFL